MISQDYQAALDQYDVALSSFNNADEEFIDIAVEQLNLAMGTLNMVAKKSKIVSYELEDLKWLGRINGHLTSIER